MVDNVTPRHQHVMGVLHFAGRDCQKRWAFWHYLRAKLNNNKRPDFDEKPDVRMQLSLPSH